MVNVSGKEVTERTAEARAVVQMKKETVGLVKSGGIRKGDVLEVADIAGVLAAKNTPSLILMCHNIRLTGVEMSFDFISETELEILSSVTAKDVTGAEMEALTAVSAAALNVYDMCKAVDRGMTIKEVKLIEKTGGKSDFRA